jgi:hypothetical protein
MNKELRFAQNNLTEFMIRKFWKALTLTFPTMCVNDGISIDFNQNFMSPKRLENVVDKLVQCKNSHVACPLFEFNYDPPNSTPHHVSALTLTKFHDYNILGFFNPKGHGSCRKQKELEFLKSISKQIAEQTSVSTKLFIYDGKNLQENDNIGLCQLFSLFYLYEYVTEINGLHGPRDCHESRFLRTVSDPNKMVKYIQLKRGGFNDKTLFAFWNAFFRVGTELKQHK